MVRSSHTRPLTTHFAIWHHLYHPLQSPPYGSSFALRSLPSVPLVRLAQCSVSHDAADWHQSGVLCVLSLCLPSLDRVTWLGHHQSTPPSVPWGNLDCLVVDVTFLDCNMDRGHWPSFAY